LAERIIQELRTPFNLGGQAVHISASIGIALHPECGYDETTLIQKADAAMYEVKEDGKNGYRMCRDLEPFSKG
jgi:diguanylate cyclase (GGDEF)-like protein